MFYQEFKSIQKQKNRYQYGADEMPAMKLNNRRINIQDVDGIRRNIYLPVGTSKAGKDKFKKNLSYKIAGCVIILSMLIKLYV